MHFNFLRRFHLNFRVNISNKRLFGQPHQKIQINLPTIFKHLATFQHFLFTFKQFLFLWSDSAFLSMFNGFSINKLFRFQKHFSCPKNNSQLVLRELHFLGVSALQWLIRQMGFEVILLCGLPLGLSSFKIENLQ